MATSGSTGNGRSRRNTSTSTTTSSTSSIISTSSSSVASRSSGSFMDDILQDSEKREDPTGFTMGGIIPEKRQELPGFMVGSRIPEKREDPTGFTMGGIIPEKRQELPGFTMGGIMPEEREDPTGFIVGGRIRPESSLLLFIKRRPPRDYQGFVDCVSMAPTSALLNRGVKVFNGLVSPPEPREAAEFSLQGNMDEQLRLVSDARHGAVARQLLLTDTLPRHDYQLNVGTLADCLAADSPTVRREAAARLERLILVTPPS